MKVLNDVVTKLLRIICGVIIVFSLLMAVIEARILFSFDWSIYDSSFLALIRYVCRLAIAIFALRISVMELDNLKQPNKKNSTILMFADISLLIAAIFILIFSANYIGVVCIVLAGLLFLLKASLNLIKLKLKSIKASP